MMTPAIDTEKLLRYVGLCKRAGGVVRGSELIEKSLHKAPHPVCVLVSSDASERTAGQLQSKCATAGVPCVTIEADKYTLAHTVGATSPCAALALLPGKGPAGVVAEMVRTPMAGCQNETKEQKDET